ncbi:MAG: dTDP-4-dehydrorhamnose reductase [Hyphomicrobiaceae bacterium]
MSAPLRIALIGAKGQVATSLARVLPASGFDVTVLARPDFDLTDPQSIAAAIIAAKPDVVINPAAHTAVDRAEDEPDLAFAINRDAAGAIAAAAASVGAVIVHYSTDYVFDGQQSRPYIETDPTGPQGVYGASKLAGEQAVAAANPRHVILRTAWVCSADGANFLKTMLRLAAERPELKVVDDQHGSPTFAADIASATARIATTCATQAAGAPAFGVFHLVSQGEVTWCGFARAIMASSKVRGGPSVPVHAITTADFPTKARRPAYSKLDTGKLARVHDIQMPSWQAALDLCLDGMIGKSIT